MIKKIKKLSIIVLLLMLVFIMKGTTVYADEYTNEYVDQYTDTAYNCFEQFKNTSYEKNYNLYLGEQMDYIDGYIYNELVNVGIGYTVKVDIENTSIVKIAENDVCVLQSKKVGKSKVTVTVNNGNLTAKKSFYVNVKETSSNKDLDSKVNDVVKIVTNWNDDSKAVLLENGELWGIDNETGKLTKKLSGNVKDYICSSVGNYMEEGIIITQKLKNSGKLYISYGKKEIKIDDVKEINDYGFLKENGDLYAYSYEKNKLKNNRKMKKVSYLFGTGLCVKNEKTYSMYGQEIFDFVPKQIHKYSDAFWGLVLDKKGNLWEYYFNNEPNDVYAGKAEYDLRRVKTKVKEIVGHSHYKDSSGEIKYLYESSDYTTDYIEEYWLYSPINYSSCGRLGLKANDKLYLNDTYILNNVKAVYELNYYNKVLIVRKDGSIWKLALGGEASLTKVRSGKESAKKISKPENLKASKSGSKNVKISWTKVDGASKYTVYRATSKNGSYKKIGTTKSGSYTDKKATVGKTYYYKIVANHKNSDYSSSKTSAVKMKIPKTPTKLKVSKKSTTSMKVSYKKSSGVTGYEVKYSTSKDYKNSKTKDLKGTSVTIKSLKKKKTYYVKVRAYQTIDGKKVYSSYTKTVKVSLK